MLERLRNFIQEWGWYLLLILLPITSMPLVIKISGSSTVGAPSGIFLFLIVVVWLVPYFINKGTLPRNTMPIIGFFSIATGFTLLSNYLNIPIVKNSDLFRHELSAILTVIIGISFYIVASVFPSSEKLIIRSYQFINLGGFLLIFWSFIQATIWFTQNSYPDWLWRIHELYSVGPLYRQRITGFTLEPSWVAHQLNLLYLPLWLSATVTRYSVFKFKLFKLSIENIFLGAGVVLLLLTLSRIGLLSFILMLAYLGLLANLKLINWIKHKVINKLEGNASVDKRKSIIITIVILIVMITFYLGLFIGFGYGFSKVDPRMADLFKFEYGVDNPILRYAENLAFASRLVYWEAGWNIFNDFPWTGVGLGNAGYFFVDKLPPYAWKLEEIRLLVYHYSEILNTKSLWIRLLAETGIIGFSFFTCWLVIQWFVAKKLLTSGEQLHKMTAFLGMLVVLGMIFEGFSIDTFALPYYWISLGLLTAVFTQYKHKIKKKIN